ncbi:MAG: cyclophilin-like fold protein [Planctomycetes bacterium]|nr:cyclophilin-like fold protein [Planctomycetota bacterium]
MIRRIAITTPKARFQAQLNDTATALAIMEALPIEARANRWGGEIYFSIPVDAGLETGAREVLQPGEIGYWPPGSALCLFFGRTPASEGEEIRAASAVNIVGRIEGSLADLWNVPDGATITIREFSEGNV